MEEQGHRFTAAGSSGDDYVSSQQHQHLDDLGGLADVPVNLAERSPRFEEPSGHANVTVQLGGTAFLNCRVLDLQDKTVLHTLFHSIFHSST